MSWNIDNTSVPGADDGTYGQGWYDPSNTWDEYAAAQPRPTIHPYEAELENQMHCLSCMDLGEIPYGGGWSKCYNCKDGVKIDPSFLTQYQLYAYLTRDMDDD